MVYTLVVHLYAKDDPEAIKKIEQKLKEASQVYSRDRETSGWYVSRFLLNMSWNCNFILFVERLRLTISHSGS